MDNIVYARPVEMIFVDAGHLVDLARDKGVPRAEFIAFAALEEIVERLTAVEAAWRAGEFQRLAKVARSVVGMSEQLGMQTVALVAARVAAVAETSDQAALAALVARLVRVGEGSLAAFGDLALLQR
jgi:DhnA family fructose-bisphosphate aldolase class Ia